MNKMEKNSKIYIAGHTGLVGSAIVRNLKAKGYENLLFATIDELDLMDQKSTAEFFSVNQPEYVILAAAKVGGIVANNTYRGQFIYENLQIQNNIIHQCYLNSVKKLLFLGSSCIYPRDCPQPIKEQYLLTNELEFTNEPYAIAKIAGLKLCESYNLQYGTNYIAVMPTNLYGLNDNFDLEKSHVLPALLRKMHLAKNLDQNNWKAIRKDLDKRPIEGVTGKQSEGEIIAILLKYGVCKEKLTFVKLWGSGNPFREFLNSDDLADACVYILENVNFIDILKSDYNIQSPSFPLFKPEVRNTHINIGSGKEITILKLAELIKTIVGFEGAILWDENKPDGTLRKLLDVGKLNGFGWQEKISLERGIEEMYHEYLE